MLKIKLIFIFRVSEIGDKFIGYVKKLRLKKVLELKTRPRFRFQLVNG